MRDRIGLVLKDRFCLVEKLGQGGGGSVYRARDLELGVEWAVKEIPGPKKTEGRMLCRLSHPSIPRMVAFVQTEEACFLVMELIKGRTLQAILEERGSLSPEGCILCAQTILELLVYLHGHRPPIIFGDIKPANIMLSDAGKLYLVDFGSAVLDYQRENLVCEGTPGFAAPEQFEGNIQPASDLYALGKTLLCLSGKARWSIAFLHPRWYGFIRKCSRIKPEQRFRDAGSALAALKRLKSAKDSRKFVLSGMAAGLASVILAGIYLFTFSGEETFWEGLKKATEYYIEAEACDEKNNTMEETEPSEQSGHPAGYTVDFAGIQKQLQDLLKIYPQEKEQRRLLLTLAANAELSGDMGLASFYYEQLLLYHEPDAEAYTAYGLFLLRQGQTALSHQLWDQYQNKQGEKGEGHEYDLWKSRLQN